MTEEFNESMINDIKEGDKVTGEVQQVRINKLLCILMVANLMELFQLASFQHIISKTQ